MSISIKDLSALSVIKKLTPNTKLVKIDGEVIIVPIWANYIARPKWNSNETHAYENEPTMCYGISEFIKNGGKRRKICNYNLIPNKDFYEQCEKI